MLVIAGYIDSWCWSGGLGPADVRPGSAIICSVVSAMTACRSFRIPRYSDIRCRSDSPIIITLVIIIIIIVVVIIIMTMYIIHVHFSISISSLLLDSANLDCDSTVVTSVPTVLLPSTSATSAYLLLPRLVDRTATLHPVKLHLFCACELRWVSEVSPSVDRPRGTVCHLHCEHQSCHRMPSHVHWRCICSWPPPLAPLRCFYEIPSPNTDALTYLLTCLCCCILLPFAFAVHFVSAVNICIYHNY